VTAIDPSPAPQGPTEKLSHLRVSGFRSIRSLDIDIGDLTVLVGANGSGKSNFVGFFNLLSAMHYPGDPRAEGLKGAERALRIEAAMALELPVPNFLPYIQVHEFAAFIFVDLELLEAAFPDGEAFVRILEKCGLRDAKAEPLTGGIATLYTARK